MSYKITSDCTSCKVYFKECKINAIKKEETLFVIDQEICVEGGACLFVCDFGAVEKN